MRITHLAFYLNGALGTGKYDHITIEDVKREIYNRMIFEYLKHELGREADLSLLTENDREELIEEWTRLADSVDEDRKMSVTRNGLCLLVAYLLEGIQDRLRK